MTIMNLPFHYFKNNKYNKKTENKVIYNNYENFTLISILEIVDSVIFNSEV